MKIIFLVKTDFRYRQCRFQGVVQERLVTVISNSLCIYDYARHRKQLTPGESSERDTLFDRQKIKEQ